MRIKFQNQGSGSTTVKAKTVKGFMINLNVTNLGTLQTYTPENIRLTVQLNRRETGNTSILSAPVNALARSFDPHNMCDRLFDTNDFNYMVILPQCINLRDEDTLTVTLTAGQLGTIVAGSAPLTFNATCTVLFGVGVENYTPKAILYQVPSSDTSLNISLGDHVTSITVVQPPNKLTSVDLRSSYHDQSYDAMDMTVLRATQSKANATATATETATTNGTVQVYNGFPIHGVQLSATIDNAVLGPVSVLVWGGELNGYVKNKAMELAQSIRLANSKIYPA